MPSSVSSVVTYFSFEFTSRRFSLDTTSAQTSGVVAKVTDFGKNIGARAKATGTAVQTAGAHAASHVRRNRAAYIAGGLGAAGMAAASWKRRAQDEG